MTPSRKNTPWTDADRTFARQVAALSYCNPFLPERIELERAILGDDFEPWSPVISKQPGLYEPGRNVRKIVKRSEQIVNTTGIDAALAPEDAELFQDLVLFVLFHRHIENLDRVIERSLIEGAGVQKSDVGFYETFRRDLDEMARPLDDAARAPLDPAHLFALFFQVRRAFYHIFQCIVGRSMPAARLRAAVWQSIFTCDMRRYRRALFDRMTDVPCLITGPSGTGKELVARAIALSRFLPFDPKTRGFEEDFTGSFHPLNLSALSPTLVESELFGHRRHAFTGALEDRVGWLETCSPWGAVFLDEIGDVSAEIQVKLLRVLETRTFQRIGETQTRRFAGKILAATNRDLGREIRHGRFREDVYYRLCADRIQTPALREHLDDDPDALDDLLLHVATRLVGKNETAQLAADAAQWIRCHLGDGYAWRGNFRELEQCVRNILIRGTYAPLTSPEAPPLRALADQMLTGALTADELLGRYCTLVYAHAGSYQETARRLGIDHRTVKSRIDEAFLQSIRPK